MIKKEVNESGLIADLFTDDSSRPRKAIIMLGGSEGGKSWSRIRRPIELFVEQGYSVLSLAYFKTQNLPDTLEEIPIEYFEKAIAWLSAQPNIVPREYVILGGSKGAEAGLLIGSKFLEIKAVIAFSPSSVVWQGIPRNRFELGEKNKSSWSYKGESLPFVSYPPLIRKIDLMLLRLRRAHEDALENEDGVIEATIKVENIQGPILLISGNRDRLWPSTIMGEKIVSRLRAKEYSYHYEHHSYGTGHNGIVMKKGCWRKIFNFLEEYVS